MDMLDVFHQRPGLPVPTRTRWQPLRLGLVDLFHYDAEEFWFRDGHLLLRGNNGTGKSKVLSLTLPFLFDAQLRASRIEPDGDPGKKMAWNLLVGSYERRNGYSWIEFGRLGEDGVPRYLTLGAGLSAVAARADVDSWFFILDEASAGARIGQDLWLTTDNGVVLTRERLRDAIEGRGQVFETGMAYRRAVDERLFHLGTKRYDALMDTLIQLRQPQLSRKPDETVLSDALTEALEPLPPELLGDVADALNQLDEDRAVLEEFLQLAQAVERFDRQYRIYAGTLSRRQARELRQAQTEFDNASRMRNEAQVALEAARGTEAEATGASEQVVLALAGQRARLETLQSDPTNQDANRLERSEADLKSRRHAVGKAETAQSDAAARLMREEAATRDSVGRADMAERALISARADCAVLAEVPRLSSAYGANALATAESAALLAMDIAAAQSDLRAMVTLRREHLTLLRRRQAEVDKANAVHARKRDELREKQDDRDAASRRRSAADADVERTGEGLVEAWAAHFDGLQQLQCAPEAPLAALAEWVVDPRGDNPASQVLQAAQHDTSLRLMSRRLDLERRNGELRREQTQLEAERAELAAGRDSAPAVPATRAPGTRLDRLGAPLWRVIDFHDHVDAAARAGLEAALEASGVLDAWLTPDGAVIAPPWHDSQIIERPPARGTSLAGWIRTDIPTDSAIPAATVDRLLAGIACGTVDPGDVEAWVSPDGRFRLGGLTGAWTKGQAIYVGFAARAAARVRRLDEIDVRLGELAEELAEIARHLTGVTEDLRQAEWEWRNAPSDQALREAHLAAAAAARAFRDAEERVAEADTACREAEQSAHSARQALEWDAADLGLPVAGDALLAVEEGLAQFSEGAHLLIQAVQEWRRARPELHRQQSREREARQQYQDALEQLETCRLEAEEARERYEVLRGAIGAKVEELRQQLVDARNAVTDGEAAEKARAEALRQAGEARAVALTQAETAEQALTQRTEDRSQAIAKLQRFAATTLLSSALPSMDLPDLRMTWTIDPALTLARRVEQDLAAIKDDNDTWTRVQRQIAEELQELQRTLSALGHQAPAEPSDWGLVVHIIYQNRPERPDRLSALLADEIAQRSELLTAQEREVLENHLQAEIATEIQRLLQAAERQVIEINRELHKRPTSTGMRYRLLWEPLDDDEGAPVGLQEARQKLLNTSADLWNAEDRRVVGAMLQHRIAIERERADAGLGRGEGGSLADLLARALDYRRWHRFRVQRSQDGQWRKLSGPASSGERALGLTVPLFAAIASFYTQGGYQHAPRLMLLDEAFAGIDDTARAHCMGLIREFDLDFVITSEREWACYAELPGVSICQLQRREGIDAVFVSRWTWDGKAKRREDDPDRRFAPQ
jgi:uncharacterized protein (TIGR02680 family)